MINICSLPRVFFTVSMLCLIAYGEDQENHFQEQIQPLLTKYCVHCHNVEKMTSGIRVDHLNGAFEETQLFLWEDILHQVSDEIMPPEDEPQPTAEQRQIFVEWMQKSMIAAKSRQAEKNGSLRRLTVSQYGNTLRDLLGIEDELTGVLPPDALSKEGFVNNEQTMLLSPLLIEAYFNIAQQAIDRCIVDENSKPLIQKFRMDLGAAINPDPFPDDLILGAFNRLLANQDFMVTQPIPMKPFEFEPSPMRTKYEFIEGYEGNGTVRGWRKFDSIYHSVFACFRGAEGYPKGNAWEAVPEGLLLRPAIVSDEIFGESSTYGPMANFKIALRELPDHGRFRVTVKAARYEDGMLLDSGEKIQVEPTGGAVTLTKLAEHNRIHIEQAGIYQADVHLSQAAKDLVVPDGSKLEEKLIGAWSFDENLRNHPGGKELVGQFVGEAKLVDSPFGKAISVDGNTGHVVIAHDEEMNVGDGEFTVAAWIHPSELRQGGIVCLGGYGYTHGWLFDMPDDRGVLRIETATKDGQHNGSVQSPPGVILAGKWQHVAVVVRRGENNTRLYVNGYEVGIGTVGDTNFDNSKVALHIGRIQSSKFFAGKIDEVRIYRRALEVAELEALIEPGRQFATLPPPPDESRSLTLKLGDRHFSGILLQPAFLVVRLPAGPLSVSTQYSGLTAIDRIVFTPLDDAQVIVKQFKNFEKRSPQIGVHMGLRRDCGSALTQVEKVQAVSSAELKEFVFEGEISNFPRPDVEKDNVNYLAGIREIAVRSEFTDGRDMPRLLIRSIDFEGPLYETWPPVSHRKIFVDSNRKNDQTVYAQEVIRSFATRAFHRPVTKDEEAAFFNVWQESFNNNRDFQQSIKDTLLVILTSPQFLFLIETSDSPDPEPLDSYELAAKLSYFLWDTGPDDQLLELAAENRLYDALDSQIERLIQDSRFAQFVDEFASQWLNLDKLDVLDVDRKQYPNLTLHVKTGLRKEPVQFLQYLIQNNLPLKNLIQSDFIMANEVVANYYDLADRTESGLEFVAIRHENENLGGLLSQAGILAGLSDGRESNPIKRGAWLARKIIAEPPDDPPPNVPDLEEDTTHLTLRERLQLHRDQQGCAKCHAGIDPWGFPFEQVDAGGLWKQDVEVDSRSTLPDGTELAGLQELKLYLAVRRLDQVTFSFLKHLSSYAIGRSLRYNEIEFLREKSVQLSAAQSGMQEMVRFVIKSEMFLEK